MITIYTSPSCSSCKKVVEWFKEQNIPFIEKNLFKGKISEQTIREILRKSEEGSDEIVSKRSKVIQEKKVSIDDMTTSEFIKFVQENPSCLKRPIIVDDHRIQVGYNADEIRAFIPHWKRVAAWACKECPDHDACDHANEDEEEK